MSEHPDPSSGERITYLNAGFISGLIGGAGFAGLWWMNFYVALSLLIGGMCLAVTAWTAAREHR